MFIHVQNTWIQGCRKCSHSKKTTTPKQLVNNLANVYFCNILSEFIKLHKHDLCAQHPALHVFYIADEKQKVFACVSAMQAVSPKIVADGLVLPLFLQRDAAATSITSIKLCNELNSWAATPLTVTGLREGERGLLLPLKSPFAVCTCINTQSNILNVFHFIITCCCMQESKCNPCSNANDPLTSLWIKYRAAAF